MPWLPCNAPFGSVRTRFRDKFAVRQQAWVVGTAMALLFLAGVPIWLKTTTVYRAELPLDEMLNAGKQQVWMATISLNLQFGYLLVLRCGEAPACLYRGLRKYSVQ
jgi:hypothetical protein